VSLILPDGVQKLTKVQPHPPKEWSQPDKEAVAGLFGISGDISINDYSYSTVFTINHAIKVFKDGKQKEFRFLSVKKNGEYIHVKLALLK
jgi:hypothetical protein